MLALNAEQAKYDESRIHAMIERNLTDDRVFGVLSCHEMPEFFDIGLIQQLRATIAAVESGVVVVVYGPGAALITWFLMAKRGLSPVKAMLGLLLLAAAGVACGLFS